MSRTTRVLGVAGTGLAVAALGLSGLVWPGEQAVPRPMTVGLEQNAVCPAVDPTRGTQTTVAYHEEGEMALQELAGTSSRRLVPLGRVLTVAKPAAAVQVDLPTARAGGASVVQADAGGLERGLSASTCDVASTSAWFVGALSGPTVSTEVTLSNVDDAPALVDLAFYGSRGRIVALGSRSVTVEAGRTTKVALGPLVTTDEPFTVQVTVTQGRVAAAARVRHFTEGQQSGSGVEWLSQADAPRADLVVPGVPAGEGKRTLLVTNPGQRAAQVSIRRLTDHGSEVSDTFASVTVAPETTLAVPVETLFGGAAGGLALESTQPVTAAVDVMAAATGGDVAQTSATRPFSGRVAMPLASKDLTARIALANPSATPASVTLEVLDGSGRTIDRQEIALAPGVARLVDLPTAESMVVVADVDEGQVAAGLVLARETGEGMAGLATMPMRASGSTDLVVDPQRRPGYASRS